jgi:protein-ribulosamine 3-kinase
MTDWPEIAAEISSATAKPFTVEGYEAVGGGCINRTYRIEDGKRRYFVKINDQPTADEMFAAEAEALLALQATASVRVPAPICWGSTAATAYIVLEYLELGPSSESSASLLGIQLAQLHHHTGKHYGWHRANTIGSTPQLNTMNDDWLHFWRKHRLSYQLRLAAQNGFGGSLQRKGDRLLNALGHVLGKHNPSPSLLHGDLWSGNHAALRDGQPVIFDPASYYGDRETDLAMTELFGGYPPRFYAAYREHYPLDHGYRLRKILYNLYHILNHVNLFGGGYLAQAEHMIDALLREIN